MNNTKPLVTIAIPTYNREHYLRKSLGCAVNQTYKNIEIIVSDNASQDNTEDVVRSFNDSRIRYFRQKVNIGALGNSNFCVKQATGDYILLLNDDDMIDHDFVETCLKEADYSTEFGVILTGVRVIDDRDAVVREDTNRAAGLSFTDFILAWFNHKVPLYLCSTLYNTRGLKEMGGFASKKGLYEDDVALFKLAAKQGRVDVKEVKASFRRHQDNFGNVVRIVDWCEDSLYLLETMCSLVPPEDKDMIKRKGLIYFCRENYVRSSRIESPINRLKAYFIVYRYFGYSYSPFLYILRKTQLYRNYLRFKNSTKMKIKSWILQRQ